MRLRLVLGLSLAGFAACAPSAPAPEATQSEAEAKGGAQSPVEGRWSIVSIDGRPVSRTTEDRPGERSPHLNLSAGGYGGNSGCNSFGGLGVVHGDRFYAAPPMQTAMGCGALAAQENAIISLIASSPRLSFQTDGRLLLSDGRRSMLLAREAALPPPSDWIAPLVLAGTQWGLSAVDGRSRLGAEQRILSFEAEGWVITGPCGRLSGTWHQRGDHIVARAEARPSRCPSEAAEVDSALIALLESRPRFSTGPNGEFLIGGGGHWAVGDRPRTGLTDESVHLNGAWRIVAIDGAAPAPNGGAQLAFGGSGYGGSAGCNSLQGYYLAHARRFFSAPPIQTEMACEGRLSDQEARVGRILTAAPAVAMGEGQQIELIASTGRLRLSREGPASGTPQARLWNGEALDVELTLLSGRPLQERYDAPATRLRLNIRRFDIASGCGRFGGVWRRGTGPDGEFEFFTDAEPEPSGRCAGPLASRLREFMRQFNGPARIQIGASGEFLMASEQQWLAGRVVRPSRRK
jgi:heat shock protein HslJ